MLRAKTELGVAACLFVPKPVDWLPRLQTSTVLLSSPISPGDLTQIREGELDFGLEHLQQN